MKEHLKGCVNSHYFLPSFILFLTCPCATIDQFLLVLVVWCFFPHSLESIPHILFWISLLLNWLCGHLLGQKRIKFNAVLQGKEKLGSPSPEIEHKQGAAAAYRGFQLPSKCSVFPVFHLLYTSTLIQRFSGDLTHLRLHLFRNIGVLYVPDMKGIIYTCTYKCLLFLCLKIAYLAL